jgi:UDP-N-acetylglucosamine 1-carboxyvinyltransferase
VLERFGCRFAMRRASSTAVSIPRVLRGSNVSRYSDATDVVTGPLVSGATRTALLAAAVARGVSRIYHPYRKAEIPDILAFLAGAGVSIEDASDHLLIEGSPRLRPVSHMLICDVVEIVTFVAAAAHLRAHRACSSKRSRGRGQGYARSSSYSSGSGSHSHGIWRGATPRCRRSWS